VRKLIGLGLILGLTVGSGCLGSGAGQTISDVQQQALGRVLQFEIRSDPCSPAMAGPCRPVSIRYTVHCNGDAGPGSGPLPDPLRVCEAVAAYLTHPLRLQCATNHVAEVTVLGSFHQRPFSVLFASARSWCGTPPGLRAALSVIGTYPCALLPRRVPSPLCFRPRGVHAIGPLVSISVTA